MYNMQHEDNEGLNNKVFKRCWSSDASRINAPQNAMALFGNSEMDLTLPTQVINVASGLFYHLTESCFCQPAAEKEAAATARSAFVDCSTMKAKSCAQMTHKTRREYANAAGQSGGSLCKVASRL
jgi:hypothetical protein